MVRGVVHVNEHALTLRKIKKWVGVNDTTKRENKDGKNPGAENERKTGNTR